MPQDNVRVAFVGRLKNAALVEFMAERGWSQARLARELGAHITTVSNWVLLKAAPTSEALLEKIEKLLLTSHPENAPRMVYWAGEAESETE